MASHSSVSGIESFDLLRRRDSLKCDPKGYGARSARRLVRTEMATPPGISVETIRSNEQLESLAALESISSEH